MVIVTPNNEKGGGNAHEQSNYRVTEPIGRGGPA